MWFISDLFDRLCSKDVRLPVQMQRAMAAEAESARDAKAKVSIVPYFVFAIILETTDSVILKADEFVVVINIVISIYL